MLQFYASVKRLINIQSIRKMVLYGRVMNYKMKYNKKDVLFMHRFAMKEELGELIFEVLFFVYGKSIRNDELDVFCCWDSLILWIMQLILILIISCYVLFCTFLV